MLWQLRLCNFIGGRNCTLSMSAQNGRGHGQPPKKGLGENLILGANQVDLVDSQAPPNSNGLLPCKVVLKSIDVSNFKKKQIALTKCS